MVQYIETLNKVIQEIGYSISKVQFSISNKVHLLSISLFCSIFENTVAVRMLFENKNYSAVPLILRSILEAHIDLIILSNSENYYESISANYHKERIKMLRNILNDPERNKYFNSFPNFQQNFTESKEQLEKLKSKGHKPLTIKEHFELANMADLYVSVYALLCQEIHNDLKSLELRHINLELHRIELFRERSKKDMLPYVDSLMGVLIVSFQRILVLLKLKEDDNFQNAYKMLVKFREETKP
jgi:hypothetical protein